MNYYLIEPRWYNWPHNGPDLVTRVLASWCGEDTISWMTPARCKGFKILPYKSFYPIRYLYWKSYFTNRDESDHPDWGGATIGAHVWNSFSADIPVRKSSNQYYTQIARTSCPKTFQSAPPEFWYSNLHNYILSCDKIITHGIVDRNLIDNRSIYGMEPASLPAGLPKLLGLGWVWSKAKVRSFSGTELLLYQLSVIESELCYLKKYS